MIVRSEILNFIFWADTCLAGKSAEFIDHARYGTNEKEEILSKVDLLRCYVKTLKEYRIVTDQDFIENGVMTLGCEQIVLSPNNSLSLQSQDKKISVNPEDINCISEEDLDKICNKIRALCSDC